MNAKDEINSMVKEAQFLMPQWIRRLVPGGNARNLQGIKSYGTLAKSLGKPINYFEHYEGIPNGTDVDAAAEQRRNTDLQGWGKGQSKALYAQRIRNENMEQAIRDAQAMTGHSMEDTIAKARSVGLNPSQDMVATLKRPSVAPDSVRRDLASALTPLVAWQKSRGARPNQDTIALSKEIQDNVSKLQGLANKDPAEYQRQLAAYRRRVSQIMGKGFGAHATMAGIGKVNPSAQAARPAAAAPMATTTDMAKRIASQANEYMPNTVRARQRTAAAQKPQAATPNVNA